MAGYLGKISAVVSVNTGDFAQKLAQCAKNVSAFANSTEQSLAHSARASQRSFGAIYSEVQKLERQLQAASRLNLSGIAKIDASSLSEAADKMRAIHSIASQLSTPLGQAVKELESMSMRVRKTLHDSMVRAQTSVEQLQASATKTGQVTGAAFQAASRDVDRFVASLQHAKDAMSEANKMGGSSNFRFQDPALYDQMRRGGSLYSGANALSANQITPELTAALARQRSAAAVAARFSSEVEQSPSASNAAGYRGALKSLELANDEIERILDGYRQIETSEKERLARAGRLLALEQQFNQAITGQSQSIDQLKSRYAALAGAAERLPAANRAAAGAAMRGDVSMAQGVISSEDTSQLIAADQALARAEAVVADEAERVRDAQEKAAQAKRDAADEAAVLAKQSATLASLEARRLQIATGEVQTVAQLDAKYASLMSRLGRLPPQYRAIAVAATAADAAMVQKVISEDDDSKVSTATAEVARIEQVVSKQEDLAAKQEEAKKSAAALQERLSRIADSIGDPAKPIDQLAAAVAAANAEIAKMPAGAAKASAEAVMRGLKPQIESATTDAEIGMLAGVARGVGSQAKGINNAPKVKAADDVFGPAVGSRASQIDQLKSKITAVQGEIEKLPLPLQVSMRPELEKIRNLFMNLGPSSTAKEIQDATLKAKLFSDEVARQSQANKFGGSFANFLDDTAAKKYEAELSAVQARMAAVGATAGGPVATAINKYRAALEQAAKAGTLGSDAVRDNMKALLGDIEKAVVAEGKLTEAQAKAVFGGIKGAGDVGRMGADKAGLALNQLAFAVDDFMSASGGIEMKIRAISNNLTQMAFIIGQTRGLFIALGAVIAAQAAIALSKFISSGMTADDTNKALNDSLAKQKSLVGELSGAYRDLSKSIGLSSSAQRGVSNASTLAAISRANYDNRTQRLVGVDPASVGERAMQMAIRRQMESGAATSRAGTLIFREEQLRKSEARARLAEADARNRAGGGGQRDIGELRNRRAVVAAGMDADTAARFAQSLNLDPAGGFADSFQTGIIGRTVRSFTGQMTFKEAAEELERLEAAIRAAEAVIDEFSDRLSISTVESAQMAATRIEAAGSLLSSALASGVAGAQRFQNSLDSLSIELSAALQDLSNAASVPTEQRRDATAAANARVNAVFEKTADIIAKTLDYRVKAALQGSNSAQALGQLSSSRLGGSAVAGVLAGASARVDVAAAQAASRDTQAATALSEAGRIRADGERRVAEARQTLADVERMPVPVGDPDDPYVKKAREEQQKRLEAAQSEVRRQQADADAANKAAQANVQAAEAARGKAQADLEAAQAADRAAAAMAQAAVEVEEFLGRTRKIAAGGVEAAEQVADMAQREFTLRPTVENERRRDEAEESLTRARARAEIVQVGIDQARNRAMQSPDVRKLNETIAGREERIRELQFRASQGENVDDRIASEKRELAIARRQRESAIQRNPDVVEARRRADDFAKKQQDRLEMAEAEARAPQARAEERARVRQGREDAMSKRDRGVLQAARDAENMAAAAGAIGDQAGRQAFVQQYFNNRRKELMEGSPLGQAQDERFNAIAGGPSRQELSASDVASMDGQRELNRLLRGDDPSRDANFAEMRQQTDLLQQIAEGIKQATGVVVDFR